MPVFTFVTLIGAGQTAFPLASWQFRFPPKPSLLEVLVNATAVGVVQNLTTGPESIVQSESPVSANGIAGQLPHRLNVEPIVDKVDAGEEIVHAFRNTSAGAITVSGVAVLTYN